MFFLSKIKNYLIMISTAIIGFFIWKNNEDKKKAEKELSHIKEKIIKDNADVRVQIANEEIKVIKKETETKINVINDRNKSEKNVKKEISEIEKIFNEVKDDEEINITV